MSLYVVLVASCRFDISDKTCVLSREKDESQALHAHAYWQEALYRYEAYETTCGHVCVEYVQTVYELDDAIATAWLKRGDRVTEKSPAMHSNAC